MLSRYDIEKTEIVYQKQISGKQAVIVAKAAAAATVIVASNATIIAVVVVVVVIITYNELYRKMTLTKWRWQKRAEYHFEGESYMSYFAEKYASVTWHTVPLYYLQRGYSIIFDNMAH